MVGKYCGVRSWQKVNGASKLHRGTTVSRTEGLHREFVEYKVSEGLLLLIPPQSDENVGRGGSTVL